jgi:hypothetical protein
VMEKRENKLSMLMKMQSDEISALNNRYDAMKKSLNDRYKRELAQIKNKHSAQRESLKTRELTREAARAATETKH